MSLDGLDIPAAKKAMLAFVVDGEPSVSHAYSELIRVFLNAHGDRFQYTEADQAKIALFREGLLCGGEGLKIGMVVSASPPEEA